MEKSQQPTINKKQTLFPKNKKQVFDGQF